MAPPIAPWLRSLSLAALLASAPAVWAQDVSAQEPAAPGPSAAPALPTEDAFERFRWYGEELIYTVQILGSEGARAGLAAGFPELRDGVWLTPLHGLVQSVGLLSGLVAIDDVAQTTIHTATGLPQHAEKSLDERGQFRSYDVTFHQDAHRADVVRNRDGREARFFRHIPSDLYDALSWIYDLRSRRFDVGDEYVYHIYDGWKLSRLTIRTVRHRTVITGLGNLQAAEVEFVREVLGSSPSLPWATSTALPPVYHTNEAARRVGVGWISLDGNQLPLGVAIETPIGSIRIVLDDWTPPDPSFRPDPAIAATRSTRRSTPADDVAPASRDDEASTADRRDADPAR